MSAILNRLSTLTGGRYLFSDSGFHFHSTADRYESAHHDCRIFIQVEPMRHGAAHSLGAIPSESIVPRRTESPVADVAVLPVVVVKQFLKGMRN